LKAASHVLGAKHCLAVGIDHGLRKTAGEELDLAEALATKCGVPFKRIKVTVPKGASILAQARKARYEALFAAARAINAPFLLTAHHQDDQVETLLIKLLRGTTPRTMKFNNYFKEENVTIVRPLLMNTRADIMKYIKRWDIPYAEDPSNTNTKYLRAWVRNELLPKMEEKSPKIRSNITKFLASPEPSSLEFDDEEESNS
jgi:tRNA(Ile)-lysidine synthase